MPISTRPGRVSGVYACVRVLSLAATALACGHASAKPAAGNLYVTSDALNVTNRYDDTTGAYSSLYTPSQVASGQLGIHLGISQNRVLIGHFSGGVEEFDLNSGAYIKTYNFGGGTQWAGVYSPTGRVLIGDWTTSDIREYDANTGAFIGVLTPNIQTPADMRIGPNGNLYVAGFNSGLVTEINPVNGAVVNSWATPPNTMPNDIAFMPDGRIIVTTMDRNMFGGGNAAWVYSPSLTLLTSFTGTGWGRPHGVDISPVDGNIYIADGVTSQVHVFDQNTYAELNPAFLAPGPGMKIVDLQFRVIPAPGTIAILTIGAMAARRRRLK